jgi:hypothetical protein
MVVLSIALIGKYYYFGSGLTLEIMNWQLNTAHPVLFALAGFAIGSFIGRTYCLLRCVKQGPFLEA